MKLTTRYTPFGILIMGAFLIPFSMMAFTDNKLIQAWGGMIFFVLMFPYAHCEKLSLLYGKVKKVSSDKASTVVEAAWIIGLLAVFLTVGLQLRALFWAYFITVIELAILMWLEIGGDTTGETA